MTPFKAPPGNDRVEVLVRRDLRGHRQVKVDPNLDIRQSADWRISICMFWRLILFCRRSGDVGFLPSQEKLSFFKIMIFHLSLVPLPNFRV